MNSTTSPSTHLHAVHPIAVPSISSPRMTCSHDPPQETVSWGSDTNRMKGHRSIMTPLISPCGATRQITPRTGSTFTAAELHDLVGGWLACLTRSFGRLLWLGEEGKLRGLPPNLAATSLALDMLRNWRNWRNWRLHHWPGSRDDTAGSWGSGIKEGKKLRSPQSSHTERKTR